MELALLLHVQELTTEAALLLALELTTVQAWHVRSAETRQRAMSREATVSTRLLQPVRRVRSAETRQRAMSREATARTRLLHVLELTTELVPLPHALELTMAQLCRQLAQGLTMALALNPRLCSVRSAETHQRALSREPAARSWRHTLQYATWTAPPIARLCAQLAALITLRMIQCATWMAPRNPSATLPAHLDAQTMRRTRQSAIWTRLLTARPTARQAATSSARFARVRERCSRSPRTHKARLTRGSNPQHNSSISAQGGSLQPRVTSPAQSRQTASCSAARRTNWRGAQWRTQQMPRTRRLVQQLPCRRQRQTVKLLQQ